MRAVVLGYHNVGCVCLDVLLRAGHEIVGVYTHRDAPLEEVWFESVADLATVHGLEVHMPEDINGSRWIEQIREQRPDAIFSSYYKQLVCREILAIPSRGVFDLRGSTLPDHSGRCAVSLHHRTECPAGEEIVGQRRIRVAPEDTALRLHGKVTLEAGHLLSELLPTIERGDVRLARDWSRA